jgi:hypothetical protein
MQGSLQRTRVVSMGTGQTKTKTKSETLDVIHKYIPSFPVRGSHKHNRSLKVAVQGLVLWPTPYTYKREPLHEMENSYSKLLT